MYRTTNQVQTALASNRKKSKKISDEYLMCRYDPLAGHKLNAIPDGLGEFLEIRDFKSTFLLSGTGGLNVVVMPTLPCPILLSRVSTDDTWTVNGTNVFSAQTGATYPTYQFALGQSQLAMSANWNSSISDSANVTAARIVTVGYRLSYVGPASSCNGYTVATPVPINLDASPTLNGGTMQFLKSDGTTVTQAVGTVRKVSVDFDLPAGISPVRNSIIARPELGMQGILKRKVFAQDHTFKPFWEAPCKFDSSNLPETTAVVSGLLQPASAPTTVGSVGYPTVTVLDQDFNAEVLGIQTMNGQETAMLLEIVTCVQFMHAPTWSLIALTSDAAPLDNAVLNTDNKMAKATPHADTLVAEKGADLTQAMKIYNDAKAQLNKAMAVSSKSKPQGRPNVQPNSKTQPKQNKNSSKKSK